MAVRREALAARREARGYTQQSLAEELGVELSTVGRWERGTLTPHPRRRAKLAKVLGVSLGVLDTLLNPVSEPSAGRVGRREVLMDTALVTGAFVAQRLVGGMGSEAPVERAALGAASQVGRVSAEVVSAHRAYQAARYDEVRELLPRLSASVDALVADGQLKEQRDALRLQNSVNVVAAKLATKAGDGLMALQAAERAQDAADAADDVFGQAAASYQRVCALLRQGRAAETEDLAVSAVDDRLDRSPAGLTWRGALTLIGAIIAARRNDPAEAERRLDEADELARDLGVDGNIGWTAFGPTNVLIHRLSAAVILNDPYGALAISEQIDATAMPVGLRGRQAQYYLDSASAHYLLGEDPLAVIHLLDTERVAPDLVLANPSAHRLIRDLLARERRHEVPGLRGLALRSGVAA